MRYVLLAAVAATALASPATAQQGFYAGIEAGLLFPDNSNLHVRAADGDEVLLNENVAHIDYDSHGFDGDVLAGYDFGMFRLEGELGLKRVGHNRYEAIESICALTDCFDDEPELPPIILAAAPAAVIPGSTEFDGDGKTRSWSLMVNALLDVDLSDRFRLYGGPGIGYHSTRITYDLAEPFDAGTYRLKDHGLAWQAIAGVAYRMTDALDVGLKYRYFRTSRLEDNFSDGDVDVEASSRFKSHSVLASLIYNFAPPPPPPPPPPMPMPEPAPAPATQTCYDGSVILATDMCPMPPAPPPPPPAPERG